MEEMQDAVSQISKADPRKPFLGAPMWSPGHAYTARLTNSIASATSTLTSVVAFFTGGATAAARAGLLGVGGPDPGARHSKSLHVPTRRHAKHHHVRQLSW
mmetsp:Transcript_52270/g.147093  ORF Transcript_52270/g.147093 Transcript_52270/m.147093 type:complete len:101 (+) Transcript_52270:315-617(+)